MNDIKETVFWHQKNGNSKGSSKDFFAVTFFFLNSSLRFW